MSRTVLVLTATGTTGSQTVAALARRGGATIRAASRDAAAAKFPAGVIPVAFSLDDRATWGPALAGADAVFFTLPPFRDDEVEVGTALLAAARAAGVTRIVKLSAAGVENAPASGHRRLELAIEASGLAWVHLRPSFFNENFINFYGATIRAPGAIYLPAGKGRTGFVAAEDIGEVAAAALLGDATGEAWTLTGPEALDHDEVAAILSDVLGKPVAFVDVPPQALADGLRGYGANETAVTTMLGLYEMVRAGYTGGLSGDVARVLGRAPTSMRAWASAHAAAWQ